LTTDRNALRHLRPQREQQPTRRSGAKAKNLFFFVADDAAEKLQR